METRVEIHASELSGDDSTILGDSTYTISVGLSLLSGGPVIPNGGTVSCGKRVSYSRRRSMSL